MPRRFKFRPPKIGVVLAQTRKLKQRFEDLEILSEVTAIIKAHMMERFDTSTSPTGAPWAPLVLTGQTTDLKRMREVVFAIRHSKTMARYGAFWPTARFHQEGTRHMVARQWAPEDGMEGPPIEEMRRQIKEVIDRYIREGR